MSVKAPRIGFVARIARIARIVLLPSQCLSAMEPISHSNQSSSGLSRSFLPNKWFDLNSTQINRFLYNSVQVAAGESGLVLVLQW